MTRMTHSNGPTPTPYQLRIAGHLDQHWSPWFGGLVLVHEADGTTSHTGVHADQAELHGLLTKIRDLGVTLISLAVVPAAQTTAARMDNTSGR